MTATVRTPANDRAANKAYMKAKDEKSKLEKSWSYTMSAMTRARAAGENADHLKATVDKLSAQVDAQNTIIEAAQKYARLTKEGG